MSSPTTASYRIVSPKMMRHQMSSPVTRRRNNDYSSPSHYDNSAMMYGSTRHTRPPRPLPAGPGPLNSDGSRLDKTYFRENLKKHDTGRTAHAPIKPVHTDKSSNYISGSDINTYSPSILPTRRGSLTKSNRTQSMSDITTDFAKVDINESSTSTLKRTNRHSRGSLTNMSDHIDSSKRYDLLQKSKITDHEDTQDDIFHSQHKPTYSSTYSSHFSNKNTKSSHPFSTSSGYTSSSKETITAKIPPKLNSRSSSQESDILSRERTKMTKTESYTLYTGYTGRRSSSTSGVSSIGLMGLKNLGNTCFMNSILQCLSNTQPLQEYCLNKDYERDLNKSNSSMKGQLMTAFAELLQLMWKSSSYDASINPSTFKTQIQRFAPRFVGYSQQDSQEFLRFLLEGLHDDINKVMKKPRYNEEIPDNIPDQEKARESWNRYTSREDSRIVDLFVGQLKSTLHCTYCKHNSVTFDPFWDLSLPIPKTGSLSYNDEVSLQDCFKLFTKEEILDGDEKPTCSKCQTKRKCIKKLSIEKFPSILVLHLKRFSATRYRAKLTTMVDFPVDDDLKLHNFSASPRVAPRYSLYGVSNHSGSTYGGHYIAYCKHAASKDWYNFDDTRVSAISQHRVKSSHAYVLFYEKTADA